MEKNMLINENCDSGITDREYLELLTQDGKSTEKFQEWFRKCIEIASKSEGGNFHFHNCWNFGCIVKSYFYDGNTPISIFKFESIFEF